MNATILVRLEGSCERFKISDPLKPIKISDPLIGRPQFRVPRRRSKIAERRQRGQTNQSRLR